MAEKGRMQSLFDAFDRLSGREKIMVGGLVGAFLLTVLVIVWMVFSSQINALEERNQNARSTMAEVMTRKVAPWSVEAATPTDIKVGLATLLTVGKNRYRVSDPGT